MLIIQIYGVIFTFVGFKSVTLWQIPSSPQFALMSSKVVKDIPRRGYFEADAILDYNVEVFDETIFYGCGKAPGLIQRRRPKID